MPLEKIETLLSEKNADVDAWFARKWENLVPPPYFSCDIRHASYKMGIVDTNLFPAGFNNLCSNFSKATAAAFASYLNEFFPKARRVVLYGENHTRNKFYLINLARLKNFIEASGRECRVTLPLERYPQSKVEIALNEKESLVIEEAVASGGVFRLGDFVPDLVLSNNDFSSGFPAALKNLNVPVIPPAKAGWSVRSKISHFDILEKLLSEFCASFDLDPWKLMPVTRVVGNVSENNLGGLKAAASEILEKVREKYAQYQITETPYVFVKNDAGTYGLGILTLSDVEELESLNRKKREKLFSAKSGAQNSRFIVQEGIPTTDTYSGFPIEPVIYGVGRSPVAGFFRVHEDKNPFESLNAPGMSFSCLCLHKLDEPHETYFINCKDKQRLVAGAKFLARFAGLAAAREMSHV